MLGAMKTTTDAGFDAILEGRPPEIGELARRLRALVAEVHPDAVEVVWAREGSAGYGLGPRKRSEHYAYLRPFTRHVGFGFFRGAALPDPAGLLEGSGKALRHVKVRTPEEAARPELRALLEAALAERRAALQREA